MPQSTRGVRRVATRRLSRKHEAAPANAAQWRTAADGWTLAEDYSSHIGAHYLRCAEIDSVFDVSRPERLLNAGDSPAGSVSALMVTSSGCAPRAGTAAPVAALIGGRGGYAVTPAEQCVCGGYAEDGSLIWRGRWMPRSGPWNAGRRWRSPVILTG